MAKLKIAKTDPNNSSQLIDANVSPILVNGNTIGGVGGNTSVAGKQIQPMVKIGTNASSTGNIMHQKGAHKFRVNDGINFGTCTLVNAGTPTVASTMSIAITLNAITQGNLLAANVAPAATSSYVTYATANVVGPATIGVGSLILGFTGNGNAAVITAVNPTISGLANVTVSVSGNVAAQNYVNITNTAYASRITNKYVYDFGNDGNLSSNIAGGYNPNKWRYHLVTPDSTFVQVASA
jgi:hypothetical protein